MMNDMNDPQELSYGKHLQEARRTAGLSTESVAESLRLDPRFVVALEEENIEVLPAPTYTRGYIRAYAQLVHCNADELIAQYNVYADDDPALTNITAAAVEKPGNGPSIFWITCIVIVALIVLLALWMYDNLRPLNLTTSATPPRTETQTVRPVESADTAMTVPGLPDISNPETPAGEPAQLTQSDVPDNLAVSPETETETASGMENSIPADPVVETGEEATFAEATPAQPENGNEVVPAAPQGSDVLRLNFRGESWAEVVDANGFRLAYGLFNGETLNLEGQAPFRVRLGDATQVDVTVNGADVALKSHIRWNKTAYLSVGEVQNPPD